MVGEEVDNLEAMLDDANSHDLLTVVAPVHHERADETLDDRALCLPEALRVVTTSGMRQVDGILLVDRDVISEAEVLDAHILERPSVEQLNFSCGSHDCTRCVVARHDLQARARWLRRSTQDDGKRMRVDYPPI